MNRRTVFLKWNKLKVNYMTYSFSFFNQNKSEIFLSKLLCIKKLLHWKVLEELSTVFIHPKIDTNKVDDLFKELLSSF